VFVLLSPYLPLEFKDLAKSEFGLFCICMELVKQSNTESTLVGRNTRVKKYDPTLNLNGEITCSP
jgi:hypothetical protein